MCREVEKLVMAERSESYAEGHAEGREEGRAEGREEGREEGAIKSSAKAVKNVMAKMAYSAEEAMQLLGLSDEEKEAVRELIKQ